MSRPRTHPEPLLVSRIGWLRAALLDSLAMVLTAGIGEVLGTVAG